MQRRVPVLTNTISTVMQSIKKMMYTLGAMNTTSLSVDLASAHV